MTRGLAINILEESWGYNQMSNAEITNKCIVYLLKQVYPAEFLSWIIAMHKPDFSLTA